MCYNITLVCIYTNQSLFCCGFFTTRISHCVCMCFYCSYESYLARYINFTPGTDKPYCHLFPLTFSMYSMDHLDSVQRRKELGTYKPELSMTSEVRHSMDDYGHFVSKAMEKVN